MEFFDGKEYPQEYPILRLKADTEQNISDNLIVINPKYVNDYIYVSIPAFLKDQYFDYIGCTEVTNGEKELEVSEDVVKGVGNPWIKIKFSYLNNKPGQHIYKFSFMNKKTNDIISVYATYLYQTDTPDKPYDYMKKYREEVTD